MSFTPRARLTALIVGAALTLSVIAVAPPASPEPTRPKYLVTAVAASEPVLYPPPPPTTTTTTASPPPPTPTTTPTEPPTASQPVAAPEAPQAASEPSGGVQDIIRQVFSPYGQEAVDIALRVAQCESKMNPGALSASGTYAGLFQVGNFWADDFARVTGSSYYDGRFDPSANARFAAWLAYEADGGGWQHWSCY